MRTDYPSRKALLERFRRISTPFGLVFWQWYKPDWSTPHRLWIFFGRRRRFYLWRFGVVLNSFSRPGWGWEWTAAWGWGEVSVGHKCPCDQSHAIDTLRAGYGLFPKHQDGEGQAIYHVNGFWSRGRTTAEETFGREGLS